MLTNIGLAVWEKGDRIPFHSHKTGSNFCGSLVRRYGLRLMLVGVSHDNDHRGTCSTQQLDDELAILQYWKSTVGVWGGQRGQPKNSLCCVCVFLAFSRLVFSLSRGSSFVGWFEREAKRTAEPRSRPWGTRRSLRRGSSQPRLADVCCAKFDGRYRELRAKFFLTLLWVDEIRSHHKMKPWQNIVF